jgi:phosphoglycerate dehydrogenase-like enzyme
VSGPLRILVSAQVAQRMGEQIAQALGGRPHALVVAEDAGAQADVQAAFVSRDVTGLSTKHDLKPATARFHDQLRQAPGLRWVHIHSAGADRPLYGELRSRGVQVTTSSGANAGVVAQTALAGVLALARRFPLLAAAQREHRWAPLFGSGLPRELEGQTAVIVGWGPIGQRLGMLLGALGLKVIAVRRSAAPVAGIESVGFDAFAQALPLADWLLLACPLTPLTRGLVDARALALLPPGAHLVNVARGEVVDEPAMVDALRSGRLAGAFLDVFAQEPLPADSPLWDMPNVIATPHSAGFSDGNEPRVARMFLDNLAAWLEGRPLHNLVGNGA